MLLDLPNNVLETILDLLSFRDLALLASVNWAFYARIKNYSCQLLSNKNCPVDFKFFSYFDDPFYNSLYLLQLWQRLHQSNDEELLVKSVKFVSFCIFLQKNQTLKSSHVFHKLEKLPIKCGYNHED